MDSSSVQSDIATKYRKGACENCGAMSHKTKDCVERPRKLSAKATGKDIQPDEVVQSFELTFDGKRDRYNGYDPETYTSHVQGIGAPLSPLLFVNIILSSSTCHGFFLFSFFFLFLFSFFFLLFSCHAFLYWLLSTLNLSFSDCRMGED